MSCTSTVNNCPICSDQMDGVDPVEYANGPFLSVRCPGCFFTMLVEHLSDEEIVQNSIQYHLRGMLNIIFSGEIFKRVIKDLPLFPDNRTDQIMTLMSSEIPPPINYPTYKSMSPLTDEAQELVKEALGLE